MKHDRLVQKYGDPSTPRGGAAGVAQDRLLGEPVEDVDQLREALALFGIALGDAFRHAGFDVKAEDGEADAIERRFGGGELLQDFDAEARLLDHPPDPADLPLDAIETCDDSLLLRFVQHRILSVSRAVAHTIP
jgi:hypothetical protein